MNENRAQTFILIFLSACTVCALAVSLPDLLRLFLPGFDGQPKAIMPGADFANMWGGAKVVLGGHIADLFDMKTFHAHMQALYGQDYAMHNWGYLPYLLFFILPLGLLPYGAALAVWTFVGLAAFAAACAHCAERRLSPGLLAAAILSPAGIVNIASGQNGFFVAALFLCGFSLLARREKAAGALFGLLTFKPHMGLLIPFALALTRHWRAILAAGLTLAALCGAALAVWGTAPFQLYFSKVPPVQLSLLTKPWDPALRPYQRMMPGFFADLRALGIPAGASFVLQSLMTLAVSVLALKALLRHGPAPQAVLSLALAAILVTPYAYNYDMTVVAGALVAVLAARREKTVGPDTLVIFGALWALPLVVMPLRLAGFPFCSVFLLAGLWAALRLPPRAAGHSPPSPP